MSIRTRPSPRWKIPAARSFMIAAPLCLIVLTFTRCSQNSGLTGSLSQVFPLNFSSVAIWRDNEAFQVTYYEAMAGEEDIVVQLTVELTGLKFTPGQTIQLSGDVTPGQPRTTVVHEIHGQASEVMPIVANGQLTLNSYSDAGGLTSGSFNLGFAVDESAESGTTLGGTFSAVATNAEVVMPDGGYGCDGGLNDDNDSGFPTCSFIPFATDGGELLDGGTDDGGTDGG